MRTPQVLGLTDKLARFEERWQPKTIASLNDYKVQVVKVEGEFVWHAHPDTDELFLVLAGRLCIELPDRGVVVRAGELCVVPRGLEHRPRADVETHLLLIEPAGTPNTGDSPERESAPEEWI